MRGMISTVVVCLLGCATANAQFIGDLTHNFYGAAGGVDNINSPSAVGSVSTVTVSGPTPVTTANMINSSNWTNSGINLAEYYTFSFVTNQAIQIPTVSINAFSSAAGPTQVELRSSLDGFTTTLDAVKPVTQNATTAITFNLPTASFGTIASGTTLEFRIYAYTASNSGTNSTFGLISSSATDNGVVVPIFAPVPEPTSMIALSCVGLTALGFRFRRKKAVVAQ